MRGADRRLPRPGPRNDLTDVAGVRVGHHHRIGRGWRTGTTVVLAPDGSVGAVDVRGGAPGTRETDALDPRNAVPHVHAVCLTGGSAYGLSAADGVMAWLEEHRVGFPVGDDPAHVVPIVPAAVLFDLGRGGHFGHRPDASFGRAAVQAAARGPRAAPVAQGSVGAGAGAVAGGIAGGIGTASVVVEFAGSVAVTVAALVAVNAAGRVFDERSGRLHGAPALLPEDGSPRAASPADVRAAAQRLGAEPPPLHTTIGVVATDLALGKAQVQKLAAMAHDGLARAVHPAHLMTDGDTFFALATGATDVPETMAPVDAARAFNAVLTAAADVVTRAIVRGVLAADSSPRHPSYRELFPSSSPAPAPVANVAPILREEAGR